MSVSGMRAMDTPCGSASHGLGSRGPRSRDVCCVPDLNTSVRSPCKDGRSAGRQTPAFFSTQCGHVAKQVCCPAGIHHATSPMGEKLDTSAHGSELHVQPRVHVPSLGFHHSTNEDCPSLGSRRTSFHTGRREGCPCSEGTCSSGKDRWGWWRCCGPTADSWGPQFA